MSPRRVQPPSPQPSLAAAARLHLRPPPAPALPPGLCLRRLLVDADSAPTSPLTRRRRLQPPPPPAECRRLVSTPRQGSLSGRWPAVAVVRLPPLVPRSPPPALAAVAAAWFQPPLTGGNPSARILVNLPWRLEAAVADGGRRAAEVATSVADGGAGGKLVLEHFMLWQSGAVYRGCIDKLLEASWWNMAWGRLI